MNINEQTPARKHYDVVIVGGAAMGSSAAWFLASNTDFDGSVLIVERDPSFEFASSSHTNSCMRQQFSSETNIRVSQFAADFVRNFRAHMGDDPRVPELPFQCFGYLYLADNEPFANSLRKLQQLQAGLGVGTEILSPEEIVDQYPFYCVDDIVAGSLNTVDEGYFDSNTMIDWWRRSARERGCEFIANEVVAMKPNTVGNAIRSVSLKSGEQISCGYVVNTSGPRAALTAAMAGIDIPVEPRKRYTYIFSAETPLSRDLPLTVDPSGVHVRTEGNYYMAGCPPDIDPATAYDDFREDHRLWDEKVWPALATRIPQFESIKLINSWVGHYAYNTFDRNAILGPHTEIDNLLFACGFSGHGMQQSPAMGRGISELVTYGEFRKLDLGDFSFSRMAENKPLIEKAVI